MGQPGLPYMKNVPDHVIQVYDARCGRARNFVRSQVGKVWNLNLGTNLH